MKGCLFRIAFLVFFLITMSESFSPLFIPRDNKLDSAESAPLQNVSLLPKIGVMPVILASRTEQYISLETIRCYAHRHGYQYVIPDSSVKYKICQECYSSHSEAPKLEKGCWALCHLPFFDYLVILDADNAVVNPERRIEEFLDDHHDIFLYERAISGEIASGGIIVKNSKRGRDFLHRWWHFTKSNMNFGNADNGSLQLTLLTLLGDENPVQAAACTKIGEPHHRLGLVLSIYDQVTGCLHAILHGRRSLPQLGIKIFRTFSGFVFDEWLIHGQMMKSGPIFYHGYKTTEYFKQFFEPDLAQNQTLLPEILRSACAWKPKLQLVSTEDGALLLKRLDCQLSQDRLDARGYPTVAPCFPHCSESFDPQETPDGRWTWDPHLSTFRPTFSNLECHLLPHHQIKILTH